MKKKLFTIAILAVSASLIVMSCSKTGNTTSGGVYAPVTNAITPGGSMGGGSLTFSSTGDPSGTYSGFLFTFFESVPAYSVATCQAGFFTTPQAIHPSVGNIGASTGIVSSIYFNGIHIPYSTTNQNYSDSTNTLVFPPAVWAINGNTTFPSFTYTCTTPTPIVTASNLPSTVTRTQNLVIAANAISGCDQVQIQVSDGTKTTSMYFSSASSISLPSDSLTKLTATSTAGNISVTLIKYNAQTLGSKIYLFASVLGYTKTGVVIQ